MSEYKEYISFKSIFYFCSLPLRLDSYKGCTFDCRYCFSQCLNNRNTTNFHKPIPANPLRLEKLFSTTNIPKSHSGIVLSCLKNRMPIHFGNVSDPFQPLESKYRVSLEFLKILQRYNYPTVISTKSSLLASPDYFPLIHDLPITVQVSFSTFNERLATKLEPNAPPPSERLRFLETLSKAGIWTVARIQPFLFPLEQVEDIPFKSIADAGVKHLMLEHLRIPTNSSKIAREKLDHALGMSFLDEYRRMGLQNSRVNYELDSKIKIKNILATKKEANNYGMTFGSADNDFHHISDLPCCCGIPNTEEFNNFYTGSIGYSMFTSIRNGTVSFDNIYKEWQPSGSIREFLNSDCRLKSHTEPMDYLISKINHPGSSNSPTSFIGVDYDQSEGYIINEEIRKLFLPKEE